VSETTSLVPSDLAPGLVPAGFAESVLAAIEGADDARALWDAATTFDGLAQKWQGHVHERDEFQRAQLFCEIELGQALGPNPGAGPGRGKKDSDWNLSIPKPVISKVRRFYGYRDELIEAIRSDPELRSRNALLQLVARWAGNHRLARARTTARDTALPGAVLALDVADARSLPLQDASVDLIVTSPPYGLAVAYEGGDVPAAEWPGFMGAWLREAFRVAKPSGRLGLNIPLDTTEPSCRATYAQAVVAAVVAGWQYRSTVVWHDGQTTKGGWALGSQASAARPHHVSQVEMIGLFSKGEWGPSSANPDDITRAEFLEAGRGPWAFSGESRAWEGHPAPFPLELPRRLIRYLCRVGDVVLDPFCGSGTTLVAALALRRQAIGFDISPSYIESTRRRLAEGRV
jgi:site-specific DNA-methyltransferase (adenine-specific)